MIVASARATASGGVFVLPDAGHHPPVTGSIIAAIVTASGHTPIHHDFLYEQAPFHNR